jgi:hypothetical protein
VLARQCQRKRWAQYEVQRDRNSILLDYQEAVQPGSKTGDGYGGKPAQASSIGLGGSDFSTVSHRQKYLAVEISANSTTTELHLLVDSTGIKMLGEG